MPTVDGMSRTMLIGYIVMGLIGAVTAVAGVVSLVRLVRFGNGEP